MDLHVFVHGVDEFLEEPVPVPVPAPAAVAVDDVPVVVLASSVLILVSALTLEGMAISQFRFWYDLVLARPELVLFILEVVEFVFPFEFPFELASASPFLPLEKL